ncbi:Sodium:dicarboxylate symporter [uncultured delta proteobacterium]|uniref:Sodium:dicarboxylate symporter n=1 Tax=uncultured delta proteobacterium TaxID=34034 RepID=A0A212K4D5_9DELT|nr:Sodium:dicarboxylate symporter [uncultured delta proteobacterium]
MAHGATQKKGIPLWGKILIGLIIGCIIGFLWPSLGSKLQPIGTAFIKAIKMIVMPLIFSAVTLGIYKMGSDLKQLGKLGIFAFGWFYLATGVAMVIGISLSILFHPGAGVDLSLAQGTTLPSHIGANMDWAKFFLDIIPDNIVMAMAQQKIIPTLFFAICFGICLSQIKGKAKPIIDVLDGVQNAMFRLTHGIIATSPYAVAGIMAWVFATQGLALLLALAKLVGVMYLGLFCIMIIFGVIVALLGENPFYVLKKVLEPFLLAFTTASSEVTLPVHMEILERTGIPNRVVSFVLPLGYSFNLDGAALGQSLYICFLAQAYGLELGIASILTILVTTLIANKGTANVPSASIVVISVVLGSLGLPLEGIAILMAVDRFMDMGRTAVNVLGNTVACLLLYRIAGGHLKDDDLERIERQQLAGVGADD